MNNSLPSLTGLIRPETEFKAYETNSSIDISKVFDVLHGRLAAYRIHNFLPADACQQIVTNFYNSQHKVPRYGEGEDGVEGYFIGASHIEKTTSDYLKESAFFKEPINLLYNNSINPLDQFRKTLASRTHVRPAQLDGLCAGNSKAVYWNNVGHFLLQPHDDVAQLSDPRQHGFEIQQATRVMAVNFYAMVPNNAGQLIVWNIEPDDSARAALDLTHSGFPYPPELLEEFEHLIIPVKTGELCLINGNLIHAVMRGDPEASSKDRLLVTCFMTFNEHNELIWWT